MDADKVPYTEVILDDEVLRYKVIDGVPYFHYRNICQFLKSQTTMQHHIRKLKLEEGSDYYLLHTTLHLCKTRKYKEYIVALPALFKIIASLVVCSFIRVEIFNDFCKETFGDEYQPHETEVGHCAICGAKLRFNPRTGVTPRKYCSAECKRLANNRRVSARYYKSKAERPTATCPYCGATFTAERGKIYCSKLCQLKAWHERQNNIATGTKSAYLDPREVYPNVPEPVWDSHYY